MKGKNYILTIAIDQYKDKAFNILSNAKFDAERFQSILIDKYDFDAAQESLFNEEATRKNIIGALNQLSGTVAENDTLIIYFAGHGKINPKTNKGFWLPFDAVHTSTHNHINNSTVIDCLEGIEAKHLLLISDSCFSGTFITVSRNVDPDKHYKKLDEKPSRWLFASGRDETVSDGKPGCGSPFSNSLINYLEKNEGSLISLSEIAQQVSKEVGSITNQQPLYAPLILSNYRHLGGEMVFKIKLQAGKSNIGWEAKFEEFCKARETRPEWPYISKENPETKSLGLWCMDQRRFRREQTLSAEREQRLLEAGFIFNPYVQKFFNGLGKFLAFMHNTGYNYMPNHLRTKYNEEYAWLVLQQKRFRKNPCNPNDPKSYPQYRYDMLKRNGIEIDTSRNEDTWPQFKINLQEFYSTNEHFITIPSQVSKDPKIADLGNKLNDYINSWKKEKLSEEKVAFISHYVDKDYQLNRDKRNFEKRINELNDFQQGDRTKIPKQGKSDLTGLGQWYAQIMTALKPETSKKLPQWKIDRLREEGIIK